MAKMSIGNFVLPRNPSKMTLIHAQKFSHTVKTLSDVAYYSWGTMIKGLPVKCEWPFMRIGTFATLDALCLADTMATFNPQDGTAAVYNVEITSVEGDYHVGSVYRKNVKMTLTILEKL